MKELVDWRKLTDKITVKFIEKYFDCKIKDVDWWWVNQDIGSVFFIADYWFNFSDAVYCLENNVDKNKFFEWYNTSLEMSTNGSSWVNLHHFLMIPEEKTKKEEEYLAMLKERVIFAEEELRKALEK